MFLKGSGHPLGCVTINPLAADTGVRQMFQVETHTVINRPVEEVFAVLSNVENNPKWLSVFQEVTKTSPGPIGVGTTWHVVLKALGQRIEGDVEVVEYEANRIYVQKSKAGPVPVEIRQTCAPVAGGTRVNFALKAEPGSFFKLAEPLVKSFGQRSIEKDLAKLKDLMEAHAL
jgi:uncharacterized membrane protein